MKQVYVHRVDDTYDMYMGPENEALLASFCEVVSDARHKEPMGEDELVSRMAGSHAILSLRGNYAHEITENVLRRVPTLEIISIAHWWERFVDTERKTGIRVVEGSNANTVAVAEWTLCCALMGVRRVLAFNDRLKAGSPWGEPRLSPSVGLLRGSTVGVVALGRIGRYVANIMRTLGAEVIAYEPFISAEDAASLSVELTGLDELFSRADVITIHLPVFPATVGLIGAAQFARIKDGTVLINSARAAVYDEDALIRELKIGRFSAYLDVFAREEPLPADHPFRVLPNAFITPHIAGHNTAMFRLCGKQAILTLKEYFETGRAVNHKYLFP